MSWPKEGSRDIASEGIIVSVPMDWCKSPTSIVPYKIWARQADAAHLANSVHQTDDRSHVKDSIVRQCHGDEPGVGGGVISGTHEAECTPKTWSESVFFEGRNAVRHTDEWWMNHKNTWGELDYPKIMDAPTLADVRTIDPEMKLQKLGGGTPPAGADKFQALFSEGEEAGIGIGIAARAAAGATASLVTSLGARYVIVNGIKIALYTGTRTSKKPDKCPCVVAPYLALKYVCGKACKDGQAHHIVPDYTMRYGSRVEGQVGQKRIKGLPGFWQGASICMKGNAKDDDTQHYEAHQADQDVRDKGMNHPASKQFPLGTAKMEDIARLTKEQAKNTRPECREQIETGVANEFANSNLNTLGRTYFDSRYPPSPDTIPALSKPTIHP